MNKQKIAEAVRKLDMINSDKDLCEDPEADHNMADKILLACLPEEIQSAYNRLVERAKWWAGA